MSANLNGNGMSDEGIGMIKDDTLTNKTPSAPGNNSAEEPEHGTISKVDRDADKMASRASNRQGNADGDIFTK